MFNRTANMPTVEPLATEHHHHLLCWKSIFGGLVIAMMAFWVLTALGAGIAGFTAESLINKEEGGSSLLTGAGLWLGLSCVISLFCGSYFALRVSRFMTSKVGAAHGFIVGSLFFALLIWGAGNMIGGLAVGLGKVAQGAGQAGADISTNPLVQDSLNKALGNANLKADPKVVAQGLAVRLMQGDVESAKNYYAYETGLSQAEVDTKIAQLKNDFDASVKSAGEKSARAVGDTGLSLFVVFVVGLLAALIGGRVGAHSNVERPFAAPSTVRNLRPLDPKLV